MSCPVHLTFRRRLPNWVQYDWLGNQTATDDDSHGFYDRSLGKVTNNTASQKPYQLAGAEQTTGTKTGALATKYDDAGNLVAMAVRRDGSCFPEGAVCSQQYRYEWDEVGRLVEARRWDVQGPSLDSEPVGQAAAHLRYGYDASDNRVIKTATGDQGEQVHTVYIFGSLELRRAQFDAVESPNDYTDDIDTEVGYLFAHGVRLARLHWDDNGSPVLGGANLHVLFELGDHLGSSSKVLDKATSELVEASTYMGYGQAESDYRPGRWKNFREDYRFTGKEEDSEVGLTYFGKRFLSSQLGRWVSADPLTVHAMGADLNLYAYVHGRVLAAVDPVGLEVSHADERNEPTTLRAADSSGNPVANFFAGQFSRLIDGAIDIISGAIYAFHALKTSVKDYGLPGLFVGGIEAMMYMVDGVVTSALTFFHLEPESRWFTKEEVAKAESLFGESSGVPWAWMRVRDPHGGISVHLVLFSQHGFAFRGVMYGSFEQSQQAASNEGEPYARKQHEMTHLWQELNGNIAAQLFRGRDYNYHAAIAQGLDFSQWGPEQQAEFVEDMERNRQNQRSLIDKAVNTPNGGSLSKYGKKSGVGDLPEQPNWGAALDEQSRPPTPRLHPWGVLILPYANQIMDNDLQNPSNAAR